ncbi:MAG: DUF3127 domain-containing protein [Salinivirgaceae bacterium]|nr:DUF3127 domain-containing protein [Salinivirgaceae bacterium]
MTLELEGKLTKILPAATGQGKNGTNWFRQDFVIEIAGQYPTNVCFSIWGDKVNINNFQIGDEIKVSFDVNSREYQDKWYTSLRPWKIERAGAQAQNNASAWNPSTEPTPMPTSDLPQPENDLPF